MFLFVYTILYYVFEVTLQWIHWVPISWIMENYILIFKILWFYQSSYKPFKFRTLKFMVQQYTKKNVHKNWYPTNIMNPPYSIYESFMILIMPFIDYVQFIFWASAINVFIEGISDFYILLTDFQLGKISNYLCSRVYITYFCLSFFIKLLLSQNLSKVNNFLHIFQFIEDCFIYEIDMENNFGRFMDLNNMYLTH